MIGKVPVFTEWENGGKWHCADTSDLANNSAVWWVGCRILDIPPDEWIKMMINDFNAEIFYDKEKCFISTSWANYDDCHRYKLYINKAAAKKYKRGYRIHK